MLPKEKFNLFVETTECKFFGFVFFKNKRPQATVGLGKAEKPMAVVIPEPPEEHSFFLQHKHPPK